MARRPAFATTPQSERMERSTAAPTQRISLFPAERVAISVVIPTLNEASRIEDALDSVRWADQVIVVDGGSRDKTVLLARQRGAEVLVVPDRTIAEQRNAGIARARNHWVLALDADESVTPELCASLTRLARSGGPSPTAYRVRSRNWHMGRELRHGPWGRDWKVRVFSRDQRFAIRKVHENLEALDDVGMLEGTLIHHPYRDVSHQVSKVATYARWAADDLRSGGRRPRLWDLLVRPAWRFVRDYVFMSGWRDGMPGFVVSAVSAFSVFLKYACLAMPAER
jgi:glycosyltransferase involved in cell wall biosynthesis